jgi:hypothetical protein
VVVNSKAGLNVGQPEASVSWASRSDERIDHARVPETVLSTFSFSCPATPLPAALWNEGTPTTAHGCEISHWEFVMAKDTQISAQISETTRELMERHVRQTGVKKGHLVEQALLHHLQALDELPRELIIHPRIVVSRKTGQEMLRQAESAGPTPALRDLMRDGD